MNIVELINTLANTPGKNDKIEFLKDNADLVAKIIFYMAYTPKYVYGLKKLEKVIPSGIEEIDVSNISDIAATLRGLHQREFTGNAAKTVVNSLLKRFTEESQEVIINTIKRDLRCGMDSSINKAIPNLIEDSPPYMRCSTLAGGKLEEFGDEFFSQIKADGMYINAYLDDAARWTAETRNGTEFPIHKFTNLTQQMTDVKYADVVLCGEVVMMKDGKLLPREKSNGITNSISKGTEDIDYDEYDIAFFVWDIIPKHAFVKKGRYKVPYEERLRKLKEFVDAVNRPNFKVIETIKVKGMDGAMQHYREARQRGEEGTVIKKIDAEWMDGTSPYQIKMKAEVEIDLLIHSLNPGNGKHADTFGSIKCFSSDDLVEGNVSGISDELREEIHRDFESYRGKVITVRANDLTLAKGSKVHKLFLPRCVQVRFDKTQADDLERIKEIFRSVL